MINTVLVYSFLHWSIIIHHAFIFTKTILDFQVNHFFSKTISWIYLKRQKHGPFFFLKKNLFSANESNSTGLVWSEDGMRGGKNETGLVKASSSDLLIVFDSFSCCSIIPLSKESYTKYIYKSFLKRVTFNFAFLKITFAS